MTGGTERPRPTVYSLSMHNAGVRVVRQALALSLAVSVLALGGFASAQQPDASQTERMVADLGLREAATPLSASPQWRKPVRVLVRNLTPERKTWLQEVAPGVELVNADTMSEARAVAATADAVLGFCEEAVLARTRRPLGADLQRRRRALPDERRLPPARDRAHQHAADRRAGDGRARDGPRPRPLTRPGRLRGRAARGTWARGASAANWTPFNALSDGDQPAFTPGRQDHADRRLRGRRQRSSQAGAGVRHAHHRHS